MQLGNGHWESTVFNNRLQPTDIKLGTTQGTSNYLSLTYSYGTTNNNGNILSQTIAVPDSACSGSMCISNAFTATQTYTYDSLNRIKSAVEILDENDSWSQTFNYDRFGNRQFDEANTSMPNSFANPNITNPTISPSNNRITSSGWSYDLSGNTLTDAGGQTFTYDGENKQVKVTNSSNVTVGEYFYDGDGKRVKKKADQDGGTTIFVYDAAGKLVAEYSYAVASIENAKVAYLTNDHLGSPRINTDRDGNVTSRHDYHPFGEEILTSQREGHSDYTPDSVRKQFTGYERDGESGLDFAQARMYSSSLGRFTTVDPVILSPERLVNPQKINLYVYAVNNPYYFTDSSGEENIALGKESEKKIKDDIKKMEEKLKKDPKNASLKGDLKALNETLKGVQEGNKIVGAWLKAMEDRGEGQGMQLSDFTLSTDPMTDLAQALGEAGANDATIANERL